MRRRTEATAPEQTIKRARPLLGTYVAIGIGGVADTDALSAIESGFDAIARIHRLMSFHEADSDVSRLNRMAAYEAVTVQADTFAVLTQAAAMAEASDGVFDITTAADLVAWGYLPHPEGACEPDPAATWRDIELTGSDTVRFHRPLWIDLGGIAKGYAVDRAVAAMTLPAYAQISVNAGGDLRVRGPATERVLLRAPADEDRVPVLEIANASLASSSGRDDRHKVDGREVGPHLNGTTRDSVGLENFVSVVADDCMVADALTKVVLAQGESAAPLLTRHNATAYFHDGADWRTIGAMQ